MTQLTILPVRDDLPRGGLARETTVVAMATTMLVLNRLEGEPNISYSPPNITWSGNPIVMSLAGVRFSVSDGTIDLTGQAVLPPRRKIQYLVLQGDPFGPQPRQTVYAAIPTGLAEPQRWAPNGPEALMQAMNQGTGYVIVGFLNVVNDTDTPWVPGTGIPTGGTSDIVGFPGFPGEMLLPVARSTLAPASLIEL